MISIVILMYNMRSGWYNTVFTKFWNSRSLFCWVESIPEGSA